MTRKCHSHRQHTNLWHHKEHTQNTDSHRIARAQYKKRARSLFLSKITAKLERMLSTTLQNKNTKSPQTNGANWANNNRTTT